MLYLKVRNSNGEWRMIPVEDLTYSHALHPIPNPDKTPPYDRDWVKILNALPDHAPAYSVITTRNSTLIADTPFLPRCSCSTAGNACSSDNHHVSTRDELFFKVARYRTPGTPNYTTHIFQGDAYVLAHTGATIEKI